MNAQDIRALIDAELLQAPLDLRRRHDSSARLLGAVLIEFGDAGRLALIRTAMDLLVGHEAGDLQLIALKETPMLSPEEIDHTPLKFGQYKGQTPAQIAEHDAQYLVWVRETVNEDLVSDALYRDCKEG